ncbi:hypothetical protein ACFVFS_24005 [Kitasatospora sp. NPDC057692]|uniref:hypothetical protein n=1 Tax=Kitasatospora sp. NPDC057692 TaxID=3346215 RepID=UPI0036796F4F
MDITLGSYATIFGLTGWKLVKTYGLPGLSKIVAGTRQPADLVPFGIGTGMGTVCGLCAGGILGGIGWLGYKAGSWGGQLSLWAGTGASSTSQFHGAEAVPVTGGGALLLFIGAVAVAAIWKSIRDINRRWMTLGLVNGTALSAVPLITYYTHQGLSAGGDALLNALNNIVSTR